MTTNTLDPQKRARPSGMTYFRRRRLWGLFFVSPALVIVAIFFGLPLILAGYMSLTDWNIGGFKEFVGLENYQRVLSDRRFFNALIFTSFYTLLVVSAQLDIATTQSGLSSLRVARFEPPNERIV